MSAPLAQRMRPQTIDDIVGQRHLLGEGKPLRNIILSGELPNMVFYGPSGVGKTTLASIIAKTTDRHLVKLNGTTASTADIKDVVAKLNTFVAPNGILLYLDEIQYFNKKQQQTLLEYIENGDITLIASTTENPYFYIYNAILSRSTVFEFKFVSAEDVIPAVKRAFDYIGTERHETYDIEDGVFEHIANACGGDVRKAINSVELCVLSSPADESGVCKITLQRAQELTQHSAMRYDREGDEHYDIISAFIKSVRGSDPDAAVYWLARMIEGGEDPLFIARRLVILAGEDIGLANPNAMLLANATFDVVHKIGMPEGRIPLAECTVYLATSPKSNSAYMAIDAALAEVRKSGNLPVPLHIRNAPTSLMKELGYHANYKYAHDYPGNFVRQQFLPDAIASARFWNHCDNPPENRAAELQNARWGNPKQLS